MRLPSPLVLATGNAEKVAEWKELLAPLGIAVVTPELPEVREDGGSRAANALLKARSAVATTQLPALADDVGLEVDALGGRPGADLKPWAMSAEDNRAVPASLCPASGGPCSRVSMRPFHSLPAFVGRTVRIPAGLSFPVRWRFAGIQRAVGLTGFACVVPLRAGLSCFVCERPFANLP